MKPSLSCVPLVLEQGSGPALMQFTVHWGESCAEGLSYVKTALAGAEDRRLILSQHNFSEDR